MPPKDLCICGAKVGTGNAMRDHLKSADHRKRLAAKKSPCPVDFVKNFFVVKEGCVIIPLHVKWCAKTLGVPDSTLRAATRVSQRTNGSKRRVKRAREERSRCRLQWTAHPPPPVVPPPPPPPTPMQSRDNKNNLLGSHQRQCVTSVIWCPQCILQQCTAVPLAWDCCCESRFQCVRGIPTWM